MSNSQTTLTNFYSQNNVRLLYDALRQSIKDSLHYELTGDEYLKQLTDIMQQKVQSLQGNIPNNVTMLNKDTLKDAIPLFIQSIRFSRQPPQSQQFRPQPSTTGQPQQQPHQQQYPVQISQQPMATQNQMQHTQQQQNGMEHLYNQLVETRKPNQPQIQSQPNFQDPVPSHQPNVNQIYQLEDQRRKQSDFIPPPDPRTLSMLPANIVNNIRPQPTGYPAPQQQRSDNESDLQQQIQQLQAQLQSQTTQQTREGFYPQDFNGNGNGNGNGNPQNHQSMSITPEQASAYNFENQVHQQHLQQGTFQQLPVTFSRDAANETQQRVIRNDAQQQQFNQNQSPPNEYVNNAGLSGIESAPQPRQMRVLIPEVSRGTVVKSDLIPQVFTVDSRDRDDTAYPNPSSYRIRLPEFKNVISIELVAAEVPVTGYVVNTSNNILHFQEDDGLTLQAIIPVGNYTADELGDAIEVAMNGLTGYGVVYVVSNITATNKFTITATAGPSPVFNLIFFGGTVPFSSSNEPNPTEKSIYESGSIGEVIGFDKVDLSGSLAYTGQYRYNLGGESNLYLHIKEADLLQSNDSNVDKAFAKVALDVPLGGTAFYQRNEDYPYIKHFSTDIGRLSHLTIQWKTHSGRLYDFNGNNQYHVLTFEIITKDITKPPY